MLRKMPNQQAIPGRAALLMGKDYTRAYMPESRDYWGLLGDWLPQGAREEF